MVTRMMGREQVWLQKAAQGDACGGVGVALHRDHGGTYTNPHVRETAQS